MRENFKLIIILIAGFSIGAFFQNCSKMDFSQSSDPKIQSLSTHHPDLISQFETSQNAEIILMDRLGVQSKLENIFIDKEISGEPLGTFNKIVNKELISQQHTFGRSCDYLSSGSMNECYSNTANFSLPMYQNSSTIRVASKIQTCRGLVSKDDLFLGFLKKYQFSENEISEFEINKLIKIFFPASEFSDQDLEYLIALNLEMQNQGEHPFTRWRVLFSTLCESPYWEIL